MRRYMCITITLLLAVILSGCCLSHNWQAATCTEPKTCTKCGKTEGEALGHTWEEATCTSPKTCTVCGMEGGSALGHRADPATCTSDSVCSVCGEVIQQALGHDWQEATCSQPRTCANCGQTDGTALNHEWLEATIASPKRCLLCGKTEGKRLDATPRDFFKLFNERYNSSGMKIVNINDVHGNNWYVKMDGVPGNILIKILGSTGGFVSIDSTGTGDIDLPLENWRAIKADIMTDESFSEETLKLFRQLTVNMAEVLGDTISIEDLVGATEDHPFDSGLMRYYVFYTNWRGMYQLSISLPRE